jgi:hypothetical protein
MNAALAAGPWPSLSLKQHPRLMEHFMRVALCVVAVLLGSTTFSYAQNSNDNVNSRWKKIEIPTIDPSAGYSARLSAGQSNYWQTPDPSSINQARRSWNEDDRTFGLTISRPLPY